MNSRFALAALGTLALTSFVSAQACSSSNSGAADDAGGANSDGGKAPDGSGGGNDSGGGTSDSGGGVNDSGGGDTGSSCGPAYEKKWDGDVGTVTLTSDSFTPSDGGAALLLTQASIAFQTAKPVCPIQTFDSCIVRNCTGVDAGAAANVSAGTITVTGGSFDLSAPPDDQGYVSISDKTKALFLGGETLTVAGSGDVVPAFSTTLTAPELIVITEPEPTWLTTGGSHYELTVNKASPLNLKWTGGDACDELMVQMRTIGGALTICRFPASAGQGTIPAAALQPLTGSPTLLVQAGRYSTVTAGNMTVNVEAFHAAHGQMSRYSAIMKLQ